MSVWTYCKGTMCVIGSIGDLDIVNNMFGKELTYDSSIEEWDEAIKHPEDYMPYGTEGSIHLRKTRRRKPLKSLYSDDIMYKKVYMIEGNLRSYNGHENDLVRWFSNLIFDIQKWPLKCLVVEARFEVEQLARVEFNYKTEEDIYVEQ